MHANMIEYLNIFIQVVEQGSFTKAADVLQIHRPTVSKAIQQIEHDLGVKLIYRTTRKLSVTAEGDEFYHHARHVLAEVNDMMASFSPTLPPRGRLRLDVPLALAHSILIPNLRHFQTLYPGIEVVLVSSDKKTDLITEGVDCLIRLGALQDSSFISRRLGDIRMVTCAAPSYLQQHERPETLAIWINIGQLTFLATTVVTSWNGSLSKTGALFRYVLRAACWLIIPIFCFPVLWLVWALSKLPMMPLLPILLPALLKRFCRNTHRCQSPCQ